MWAFRMTLKRARNDSVEFAPWSPDFFIYTSAKNHDLPFSTFILSHKAFSRTAHSGPSGSEAPPLDQVDETQGVWIRGLCVGFQNDIEASSQ